MSDQRHANADSKRLRNHLRKRSLSFTIDPQFKNNNLGRVATMSFPTRDGRVNCAATRELGMNEVLRLEGISKSFRGFAH